MKDLDKDLTHLFPMLPFLPPKNIKKHYGFLMFQAVAKGCIENKWVALFQRRI